MRPPLLFALATVWLASPAWAQPVGAQPPASAAVAPAKDPTLAYYPPAALKGGIAGSATVVCKGSYKDCRIEAEAPSGQGFGDAAVAIVRKAYASCDLAEGHKDQFVFAFEPSGPTITPDLLSRERLENPHWLPFERRAVTAYPDAAARRGMSGSVVLDCAVRKDTHLSCKVASETPQGQDFGRGALTMAPLFRVSTVSCSGDPVAGRHLTVPINFKPPPRR